MFWIVHAKYLYLLACIPVQNPQLVYSYYLNWKPVPPPPPPPPTVGPVGKTCLNTKHLEDVAMLVITPTEAPIA